MKPFDRSHVLSAIAILAVVGAIRVSASDDGERGGVRGKRVQNIAGTPASPSLPRTDGSKPSLDDEASKPAHELFRMEEDLSLLRDVKIEMSGSTGGSLDDSGDVEADPPFAGELGICGFSEGFEGAFPGDVWFCGDTNGAAGADYWDDIGCFSRSGGWSGWCSDSGDRADCGTYDNYMDAYCVVETEYFGLTANGDNHMRYARWCDAECGYDYFFYEAEGYRQRPSHLATPTPGADQSPDCYFASDQICSTAEWEARQLNLGSCFDSTLYVRLTFWFHSDGSVTGPGCYLDDLDLSGSADTTFCPCPGGFDGCGSTCQPDYALTGPATSPSRNTCGSSDDCSIRGSEEHVYQVTIPSAGNWTFSVCGSSFDTYMYVGTAPGASDLGTNDDACGVGSELTLNLSPGTYYVTIEGYSSTSCGAYQLQVAAPCADFSVSAPYSSPVRTTCGAQNNCGLTGSEEHIYRVDIPSSGLWTFSTCGSSYDTYLYVGDACCAAFASNDDSCALQSEIAVDIPAGTYFVAVEGYGNQCGEYQLQVRACGCGDGVCTPECAEDACSCPQDCGASCGDGCCSPGESACGCPQDCPATCGDGCCSQTGGVSDDPLVSLPHERRHHDWADAIPLRNRNLVPEPGLELKTDAFNAQARAQRRHYIVQLWPDQDHEVDADLARLGLTVVQAASPRVYMVRASLGQVENALADRTIRWAGALDADDKLSRGLRDGGRAESEQARPILITFHPDVPIQAALDTVRAADLVSLTDHYLGESYLIVHGTSRDARRLAENDITAWLQPYSDTLAKAVSKGEPVHFCPGPINPYGTLPAWATRGPGWDGPGNGSVELTYFFLNHSPDLTAASQEQALRDAMAVWSQFAAISWRPASGSSLSRSLDIGWFTGDHGDGNPFDGPGQVLAHAYYPAPDPNGEPIAGDVHFDDGDLWEIGNPGGGMDLFSVALHEIGHALGLAHSDVPDAVMAPSISSNRVYTALHADDITGIRSLYAQSLSGGEDPCVCPSDCAGCCADSECDDGDPCTSDQCVDFACQHGPAGECCYDTDCNEGGACTVGDCINNTCQYRPIGDCCTDAECADSNPCTLDRCVNFVCRHDPAGECCTDAECNDLNACTLDRCVDFTCVYEVIGACCDDADCDDGNACTIDSCAGFACQYQPDPGCQCTSDADCADWADQCNEGVCDLATHRCQAVHVQESAPCDDNDPCTGGDQCLSGICVGTYDPELCMSPGARRLPATFCPEAPAEICIGLNLPVGASAVGIEDCPPSGWDVVEIYGGGAWDASSGKVKWGPFFGPFPQQVCYVAVPPLSASEPQCAACGTVSIDGNNSPTMGDECITTEACCPFIPADAMEETCADCGDCSCGACEDGRVELCEMIGLACAWKKGCNDDLATMTRSAYLWKNGEDYCWDEELQNWSLSFGTPAPGGCCAAGNGLNEREPLAGQELLGNAEATLDYQRGLRRDLRLLTVTITLESPVTASAMAFEYYVPQGWQVDEATGDGTWDPVNRKVKWGPFFSDLSRTVSFTARPILAGASRREFTGTVSFDGINRAIGTRPRIRHDAK